MGTYFHSVTLDEEKCKGCTNCIKRCPTEAIRVREGKARIIEDRCIDCGECIRVCPNHAKAALTDNLERLKDFKYNIALPAPSLYGQFNPDVMPGAVLTALTNLGFDDVFEVALAAEAVSRAVRDYIKANVHKKPLISSACPAVVRLMQVRFPALLEHVISLEAPMEVAARAAKRRKSRETGLTENQIGTFFITPCPAKVTAVKQPFGETSSVDGTIAISSLYGAILKELENIEEKPGLQKASGSGIGWCRAGGENLAVGRGSLLAVDGIHNVISVLGEIERGGLNDIEYLEAQACTGGCIGGPLVVQNPFVARVRIRDLVTKHRRLKSPADVEELMDYVEFTGPLSPRPVLKLDDDIAVAITMMDHLERTVKELPGLDCGSCGSPNCRALAEDIVRGFANETYCIFKLRERVQALAEEMLELSQKVPPAMGRMQGDKKTGEGDAV
ncbi:MAG: 4Fe-4S binding protein [Firmicutes bacterium]|nr:4Fe-4S binding protein [Bacillota bacterium]